MDILSTLPEADGMDRAYFASAAIAVAAGREDNDAFRKELNALVKTGQVERVYAPMRRAGRIGMYRIAR